MVACNPPRPLIRARSTFSVASAPARGATKRRQTMSAAPKNRKRCEVCDSDLSVDYFPHHLTTKKHKDNLKKKQKEAEQANQSFLSIPMPKKFKVEIKTED